MWGRPARSLHPTASSVSTASGETVVKDSLATPTPPSSHPPNWILHPLTKSGLSALTPRNCHHGCPIWVDVVSNGGAVRMVSTTCRKEVRLVILLSASIHPLTHDSLEQWFQHTHTHTHALSLSLSHTTSLFECLGAHARPTTQHSCQHTHTHSQARHGDGGAERRAPASRYWSGPRTSARVGGALSDARRPRISRLK